MSRGEVTACTTKAKARARAKATDFVGITNGVPAATVRIAVFYTADSLGRLGWQASGGRVLANDQSPISKHR